MGLNESVRKQLDEAWLNLPLGLREENLFNPLENIPPEYEDRPHIYVLSLLQNPDYFAFVCKEILNVNLLPTQLLILKQMWTHKFPMLIASRGFGKSFLLAVYCMLRMLIMPGRRIVIAGAAFRQSKVVFGYMEQIWRNAPILRDIFSGQTVVGPKREPDMFRFHLGDSITLAIPTGDGSTIRGLRANDIIADEFASITREVFEVIIKGFAAVRSDVMSGVQYEAAKKLAKRLGIDIGDELKDDSVIEKENQIIIAGTAYYDFNHFAEYHKKYHTIIKTKGNPSKIGDLFGEEGIPDGFEWTDYCIIRIPYELIPKGFMDDGIVLAAKASNHVGLFHMEYGACFSKDSYGFFKRSLIESCVISPSNKIELPSGIVNFTVTLYGNPTKKYVFGIDTASEVDRFTINILEPNEDHRRIVYAWSTNRKEFKLKLKAGLIKETDYYGYCARKIRDLMKTFHTELIVMDSQGGGIAVSEALHDKDKLESGETQIWPTIVPGDYKDTDGEPGLHILELVNFADSKWTSEANHGMKKDMEDKVLLFPYFDALSLGLAEIDDDDAKLQYDTMEDCLMEIEELKNELSTIVMTQTNNGRDRWDTPEVKLPGNKKGRLRKDRYSALLMANMGARQLVRNPVRHLVSSEGGGFAVPSSSSGRKYVGPSWISSALDEAYS